MDSSLGNTITELVLENQGLRKREEEERTAKLSLVVRKKELEKLVRDLRRENSRLEGLLENRRRTAVASTPTKITAMEIHWGIPMTPVLPIPFKLGRKRGGGEGEGSGLLSRVVVVAEGKRRKVEEEVGTRVDPEKEQGT